MKASILLSLIALSEAAPLIITRMHTAPAVTEWKTYTTNTVTAIETVVQTINGPPPNQGKEATPATTETPTTTSATTETPAPTTPTSTETPTTPTTTETPTTETPVPTTPTTTETPTPTTPTTTEIPTTETPTTETPTTPTTETPAETSVTSTATPVEVPETSTTPTTTAPTTTWTPSTLTTITSTSSTPTPTPTTTSTTSTSSTSTSSTSSTAAATASALNEFQTEILNEHNNKRDLHGVQHLSWDDELAKYAADYAASSFSCDNVQLIHSHGPYGENLAAGYTGGASPVDAWYDEISQYDYNNPGFSEATGHFTQVIWKDTTKLGCAYVTCNNAWRQYTICEYSDSRGNIVGTNPKTGNSFFVDNVVRPLSG